MIFAKMKIGPKMGLVFGFILFMLLLVLFLGMSSTAKVKDSMEGIVKGDFAKTNSAFGAVESIGDLWSSVQKIVLMNDRNAVLREKKAIE